MCSRRDDNVVPFSGKYAISDATLVNLSANIACCTTLLGGHLSFLDWRGRSWTAWSSSSSRRRGGCLAAQSSEEGKAEADEDAPVALVARGRPARRLREAASSKAGGRDAGF